MAEDCDDCEDLRMDLAEAEDRIRDLEDQKDGNLGVISDLRRRIEEAVRTLEHG